MARCSDTRRDLGLIAAPCGLLLAGAAIGLPLTLDPAPAWERLLGVCGALGLGVAGLLGLRRLADGWVVPALLAAASASLLGSFWIVAGVGADSFRGPVGALLQRLFQPLFGRVAFADPIAIANTRFIFGYNGVSDLCLVALWTSGAALWTRPGPIGRLLATVSVVTATVLLIGSGSRGGLLGLVAGLAAAGVFGWRRGWMLAPLGVGVLVLLAGLGVLDKGFDVTSTSGRLTFWGVYARVLTEYPLTGVGLGLDTAYRVVNFYEANPYPDGIYYAHNTFLQTYFEAGPLGTAGMLALPLVGLLGAAFHRLDPLTRTRQALLLAGIGLLAALEMHGLTDQVVTTNLGTSLLVLATVAILASLGPVARVELGRWVRRLGLGALVAGVLILVGLLAIPTGRAQLLLNLGSVQLNQAMLRDGPADRVFLGSAQRLLEWARSQDGGHPGVLRQLAWARLKAFDTDGALDAIQAAAASPRLDPFDMLQIAHVYRDLGFANDAYALAIGAFEAWGRAPADPILLPYEQATLADDFRAQTLARQGESALRAHAYAVAVQRFEQALGFQPASRYLQDRLGAAQRAVQKYGPGDAREDF